MIHWPKVGQYWFTVYDAGPTLNQHWVSAPYLLGSASLVYIILRILQISETSSQSYGLRLILVILMEWDCTVIHEHMCISSTHIYPHLSISSTHIYPHLSISSRHVYPHISISSRHIYPHISISSTHIYPHISISSRHIHDIYPHISISPTHIYPHLSISSTHIYPHLSMTSTHIYPLISISSQEILLWYLGVRDHASSRDLICKPAKYTERPVITWMPYRKVKIMVS